MKLLTLKILSHKSVRVCLLEAISSHFGKTTIKSENEYSVDGEARIIRLDFLSVPKIKKVRDISGDTSLVEGQIKVALGLQTQIHTPDDPEDVEDEKEFWANYSIQVEVDPNLRIGEIEEYSRSFTLRVVTLE